MKRRIHITALVLVIALLLTMLTACGGDTEKKPAPDKDKQPEAPSFSEAAEQSLDELKSCLVNELIGAAYLGNLTEKEARQFSASWLNDNVPALAETLPFIGEIPDAYIFGNSGDLFCVIPRDDYVTISVKTVEWKELGNGAEPVMGETLYESDNAVPLLVFVNHGDLADETDIVICASTDDGSSLNWYPTIDESNGSMFIPTDEYDYALLYDFTYYGQPEDGTDYLPEDFWTVPTDLGLANTKWECENGWVLHLGYDESAENCAGGAVVYEPVESEDGTMVLSRSSQGTWWIEGECIYLDLYDNTGIGVGGLFPILIAPSGEQLCMMQSKNGTCPPFFEVGAEYMMLTLIYE